MCQLQKCHSLQEPLIFSMHVEVMLSLYVCSLSLSLSSGSTNSLACFRVCPPNPNLLYKPVVEDDGYGGSNKLINQLFYFLLHHSSSSLPGRQLLADIVGLYVVFVASS